VREVLATVRAFALPGEVDVFTEFRLNWLAAHGESLRSDPVPAV
jgi:hypothetical protein